MDDLVTDLKGALRMDGSVGVSPDKSVGDKVMKTEEIVESTESDDHFVDQKKESVESNQNYQPSLFDDTILSGEANQTTKKKDALSVYQTERVKIFIDPSRDENLTAFGRETLEDRYLLPDEAGEPQKLFARVASHYADNSEHAQRIYDYISNLWFMPATPVLSNGGSKRGLPISCFLNEASDSLEGIVYLWN